MGAGGDSRIVDMTAVCRARGLPHNLGSGGNGLGTTVGLVDGHVDCRSPDLIGADIVTRDFIGDTDQSHEPASHGTRMATLLVGQGRRQMRGLVPRARLVAARAIGPGPFGEPSNIASAIDWLVAEAVDVVALPLGAEHDSPHVEASIARGVEYGIRFFAACGSGAGRVLFPARLPFVIAVGPADMDGKLLRDARHDPEIDLLAPGWKIPGLTDTGALSGSSIACTIAAGMAAATLGSGLAYPANHGNTGSPLLRSHSGLYNDDK